ncbi:DNA cytosine methyltransferase [Rhizobium leguminosarum]|uniref:DNA cytosine methyltransferase n=1 Tax=Rhizobium leguminosarum TaxID=384 RepID=UPI0014410AE2|nr:DNA cytosine methyltransferase [Rhizobium leguminosarum]MBY5863481.1 DNA cytosine methyltransferase [Rhizobium leguminosarum]NKM04360.1 DNA (cytosine-5-)-methyltransferase [Rhizobium leguminosarum bv. viciae]
MTISRPTGIELFAGCGGLSTGFLDAGLRVAAGFELDARAVDAYNYNHEYRGSRGFLADLSTVSGAELLAKAGIKHADFIIGGPPCQPFSIAGKRQGKRDVRADLIGHFIRIVDELKPSVFMLENVPNLASIDNGEFLDEVKTELRLLGYSVDHIVVSAADFGVPQNRKRLVVLGAREKRAVIFPPATHGTPERPHISASSAINDLPDAGEFGETGIYNHEPTMHSADMVARLTTLEPGKRERGSFHDRLHPERPSYTLRAGSGNFSPLRPVHYRHNRVITVRESARLQGFSDDFRWPDRIPRLQQYRQVGNAVPPPLSRAFAECLADQMGWQLDPAALVGDSSGREPANVLTDDERKALRAARMRGASLGKVALTTK